MSTNQNVEEDKKIKEYKERFIRWHLKQIDLLTFLINFLFTISIAISGFVISNQDKCLFKCKLIFDQLSLSRTVIFMLAISVTFGIFALVTRLEDFRRTKEIPKRRREIYEAKKAKSPQTEIDDIIKKRNSLQSQTKNFGKATWILFYVQLIAFTIALWTLVCFT